MSDVRLTATNPADSSVVPVACNDKGELLVDFDGNITGDLTVSGSATFADNVTAKAAQFGDAANQVALHIGNGSIQQIQLITDGSARFGGTLPGSPKAVIYGSDGSATFASHRFRIYSSGETVIDSSATIAASNIFSCKSALASGNEVASIKADGSATFTGNITAGNVSDIKFKENITDANPQLADVTALGSSLKNWDWKEEAPLNDELKSKRFLGLIAQEAEQICPGLTYEVGEDEDSYKAINNDVLLMKVVGAVAELKALVDAL